MLSFCAVFWCMAGLSFGNILIEVSKELRLNQVGKPVCELRADLRDCEPAVNSRSHLARPGTVCRNNTGSWQCYSSGQWKQYSEVMEPSLENLQKTKRQHRKYNEAMNHGLETENLQKTNRRRHKRLWWFWTNHLFCLWNCRTSSPAPAPNNAPTIDCPVLGLQRPKVGTSMKVTWTEPEGNDHEEGKLKPHRTGTGPGNMFEEGDHMTTYYVSDNKGAASSCHVTIDVKDTTPPVFLYGCSLGRNRYYAEKQNQPKSVTWPLPEVTDNTINVTVTSNPANGSLFEPGVTSVTLTATDNAGNIANCYFWIEIYTLQCPEPDLGDERLMYNCSEGYGYGYSCSLMCEGNAPQEGSSTILCEIDESAHPPKAMWTWPDDAKKPFCKSYNCPDLPAPENGALACDEWFDGPMCVMSCNEKYDIPQNSPDNDIYTCGKQTGLWFPNDKVYGCTEMRRPGQMELKNELYYFAGLCMDEATLQNISENFVHILITNQKFKGICGEFGSDCQAKSVDVTCGETSNRKRRHVNKRESHMVIIEFSVYYELSGDDFSSASSAARENLNSLIDVVYELLDNGELDMTEMGLTVQSDSYLPGYPTYRCENGVVDIEKGSCLFAGSGGCPKGTFTSGSEGCVDCPVGKYNDVDFASSCTSCDEGFSTKSTGSTSSDYCIAKCPTGSYSSDGIEPCILCDSGTFADSIGSTSCSPCSETETSLHGATSSSDCVAYDLRIEPGTETMIAEVTTNLTSATLAFWFRANTSAGHTLLKLKNSNVVVTTMDSLSVDVSGSSVDTGARPFSNQWQHVALTLDGSTKEMAVFLMGQEVYRDTHASLGTPVIPETSSMTSTAVTDDGEYLVEWNNHCQPSCLHYRTTVHGEIMPFIVCGKILVTPSLCDSEDGCKEDPCGSHPCQDTLGSFHCDCQDGWTGSTCEIPPEFCANIECQNNAICKNELTDFACMCPQGFKGDLCEIPIVNGKWSEWTSWTACSKTCDGGVRERSRACDSPPPDVDGDDCEGEAEELEECGEEKCKECSLLKLSFGNKKTCWEEDNLQKCNVTCKTGMVFTDKSKLLEEYVCGAVTNFVWNHQEVDGDRARPPPCTEAEGAVSYSAVTQVNYPELPCTTGEQEKEEIITQISESISDLHCVKDNTCSAEAKQDTCGQASTLRKRDITPTVISVTMTTEMTLDISDDLEAYASDGTVSEVLENYIQQVLDADMTLQQMVNDSDTFFRLSLNGVLYNIDQDTITTESFINCRAGTVPTDGICAGCPPGTKGQAGSCVLCETGRYQDLPASTECKPCPKGKTTHDTGSLDVSECSVYVTIPEEKDNLVLKIVLPCVIVTSLIVGVMVSFFAWKKCSKRTKRQNSVHSLRQISLHGMKICDSSWSLASTPHPYSEDIGAP